eukprot:m.1471071 g.1471071  ORF g.1471071 m.1471071 type:complete len:71 (+) comp25144_c0_seq26:1251-1463(+)
MARRQPTMSGLLKHFSCRASVVGTDVKHWFCVRRIRTRAQALTDTCDGLTNTCTYAGGVTADMLLTSHVL